MTDNTNSVYFSCEECEIRQSSMFDVLGAREANKLTENKTCSIFPKGQILFVERARPLGVYCINKGKVKVSKLGIDGKEQIVHIFVDGDLLGYRSMLAEEPYMVTAETLEETTICFIPKNDFLRVLKESPAFNTKITQSLSKELGIMVDSITNLAQKTVKERLAITLLALKDTYNLNGYEDGPVSINLSRDDMANIIGTATETLIRILHNFKEEKLIESTGRKIKVLDAEGLARIANLG